MMEEGLSLILDTV